jgi:ornithine cyclodeaminase
MEPLRLLTRRDVRECLRAIDVADVVENTLVRHAKGQTVLPAEGYLPWTNSTGAYCRSLAMLGGGRFDSGELHAGDLYGVKLINAAVSNPARGLERAGGCVLLFDPETARPRVMAEAGLLSALRTAAYTVVSLRRLGSSTWDSVGLVGTGTLARGGVRRTGRHHRDHIVRGLHPPEWLSDGTFVAHVSLDDLRPEVFTTARAIYVDDLDLVVDNQQSVRHGGSRRRAARRGRGRSRPAWCRDRG